MATETIKRCDIFDTKKDVISVELILREVGEDEPASVIDIKDATLDVSPKALKRLLGYIDRGLSKPSRATNAP